MMLSGNKLLYTFFLFSGMAHALIFLGKGVESGSKNNLPYQRPLVVQLAVRSDRQGVPSRTPDHQTQRQQTSSGNKGAAVAETRKPAVPEHLARRQAGARYMRRKISTRRKIPVPKKNRHHKENGISSSGARTVQQNSRPPRYGHGSLDNPSPQYPYRAIKHGMEGSVLIRAFVERDGRVRSTRIERSSGYPLLDQAASQTVARWKFLPALKHGVPVTGEITVPIRFTLRKQENRGN